ncbi:MAG TPA: TetR/AcrR family transcriptional regulator [Desulfobacteraceae bacterium]|nr:MAG: TetR/AcrR family transcriptional regulator [Deltaproteobacteria bacterium]HDZ23884.1 TetR/AcrR family transcriptional regulator [Desulfobacteraceae bacterium]
MDFQAFRNRVNISEEGLYREFFRKHRDKIKVKKEDVAIRNLKKIFEAALSLSNKKGFSAMSMRDLSAGAGLSMGALYSYFSSKDELLDMIQQQSERIVADVLIDQVEGIEDPRLKLKRAILTHLYLSEIMHPWFYFSYMEAKNLGKEVQKKAIELALFTEKIFFDIIEQGEQGRIFRDVNKELVSAVIKAMLQDWYLKRWKYEMRNISVEEYAAFVVDLVDSYLLS